MKLEHTPGASALLWLGLVALVVGCVWLVAARLNLKKHRVRIRRFVEKN